MSSAYESGFRPELANGYALRKIFLTGTRRKKLAALISIEKASSRTINAGRKAPNMINGKCKVMAEAEAERKDIIKKFIKSLVR